MTELNTTGPFTYKTEYFEERQVRTDYYWAHGPHSLADLVKVCEDRGWDPRKVKLTGLGGMSSDRPETDEEWEARKATLIDREAKHFEFIKRRFSEIQQIEEEK